MIASEYVSLDVWILQLICEFWEQDLLEISLYNTVSYCFYHHSVKVLSLLSISLFQGSCYLDRFRTAFNSAYSGYLSILYQTFFTMRLSHLYREVKLTPDVLLYVHL